MKILTRFSNIPTNRRFALQNDHSSTVLQKIDYLMKVRISCPTEAYSRGPRRLQLTITVKIHWIQNAEFQQPPASVDEPEVREQGGAASGEGRAGQAPGGA